MPIPSAAAAKRIRRSVKYTEDRRSDRTGPRRVLNALGLVVRVFRTTGSTQDGTNNRWVYTAKRLGGKAGTGYAGTWSDDAIDTDDYTLYSLNEKNNGATGDYGNGVTQANLDAVNDSDGGTDGTFAPVPIPDGTLVSAFAWHLNDGSVEWWIDNLPNGVDGECPVPA